MRLYGIFFSATLTTKRVVEYLVNRIGDMLGVDNQMIDITTTSLREEFETRWNGQFTKDDIVVFGSPVYIGRMPNLISPFYNTINGGGARCIAVALFGNRSFDNGLIELCDILNDDGFDVIAAGAFVGEHSFSRKLAAGRPDDRDIEVVEQFADGIIQRITKGEGFSINRTLGSRNLLSNMVECCKDEIEVNIESHNSHSVGQAISGCDRDYSESDSAKIEAGQVVSCCDRIKVPGEPYPYQFYKASDKDGNRIDIRKVKPKTDVSRCSRCGYCASICPMGSIDLTDPTLVNGICIKCGACVKRCPQGAKYIDDEQFMRHLEMLEDAYVRRAEPQLFYK